MFDTEMSLIKQLTRIANALEKLAEQNKQALNSIGKDKIFTPYQLYKYLKGKCNGSNL